MFHFRCTRLARRQTASFSWSLTARARPNRPLDLDSSLQALLKDVDIALTNNKVVQATARRELDIIHPDDPDVSEVITEEEETESPEEYDRRKSPAAHFGSRGFGSVVLPLELQNAINVLISDTDKTQLHSDAKRLFLKDSIVGKPTSWDTKYETTYGSRIQEFRHGERDGHAFASVALPAHYSAIIAVLDHVKHRLESDWCIKRVVDWGAGTGSGIWAALQVFQNPEFANSQEEDVKLSNSTVESYFAIEKRDGLSAIGKRLVRDKDLGNLDIFWQRAFHEEDKVSRAIDHETLALSAFILSSLSSNYARQQLITEIWESGAHTIVLLDHATKAGFEAIVEARQQLLKMGTKEFEDPEVDEWPVRGCHVVAPCPHDKACPLHHPGEIRLVCKFSQRLQRPSFVRLTKHSSQGHEDIEYSYVVLRRGKRPDAVDLKLGRIGEVGKRDMLKQHLTNQKQHQVHEQDGEYFTERKEDVSADTESHSPGEVEEALRLEAYNWPRLVFPPLKRSGHVILDGCTNEGKLMRMTVPKSQGKQPFYDARKASWGDIFPHEPKNEPLERHQPSSRKKKSKSTDEENDSDIGKRQKSHPRARGKLDKVSYNKLSEEMKQSKKQARRARKFRPDKLETTA
ncbi:mitochondrial small ribosomal subunit Rsm22-domain-containing protein [Mycena floridula]|nr:mitochondrial small ribosomal subunit Rsm22-domain-containing protein [Mycena floridula]